MNPRRAQFRFYAELNDFLPPDKRQVPFDYEFTGAPSVKDAIEAVGVPHPEVDLVVVGGVSVDWNYHLADGDRVSVYPVFESVDIAPLVRLRPAPLRVTRFIADVHLGRLARRLRMLGFDTTYDPDRNDKDIISSALRDRRIILTRDRDLLKNKRVTHGYWVRSTDPRQQLREVVARMDLRSRFAPFTRCMRCNGVTAARAAEDVSQQVPKRALARAGAFRQCVDCGKVFWEGTHVERMRGEIDSLLREDR